MKKSSVVLAVAVLVTAFGTSPAFAQSSGSFNYAANTTECTDIGGLLGGGITNPALTTTMKVSSGNGVALVIRPSAVTGLLTNVKLSTSVMTGLAQASIQFSVTVTPLSGQHAPTVTPSAPVTYDDRFVQISNSLFSVLDTCTAAVPCTFDFNETTLSAHSYDFVVTGLSSGNYGITVSWAPKTNFQAPNSAMACVGPVVVTAQQMKIFNQSAGIAF